MMGLRFGKTFGVHGMSAQIAEETMRDGLRAMIKAADKLVDRAKQKLSVQSAGPSAPGEPPHMHEGMIRDSIGRTAGVANRGSVAVAWGSGVGPEALAKMEAHAARRGETLGDMFAIVNQNEYGSVNYDLARSHPPRPFVRNTEEELRAEIVRDIERAYL